MRQGLLLFLTLFLVINNFVIADDVQFNTSVSNNPVVQGEPFRIQFSINTDASNFRPPSFNGFDVLSGPSQSSSIQIINGNYSRSLSFTYVLKAKNTGSFSINPASIQVEGKRVRSNPITITVVEPSQAEKERRKQAAQQEAKMQGQANDIIKNNIYLRTSVSKTSTYVGEELTANFKLYVNGDLNVIGLEMESAPILNGFWSQEINLGDIHWEKELVNGVWFRVATLKQVVLFPQQSGKLTIDPYKFKTTVRLRTQGTSNRRRSFFDQFFNRGSYKDFEYKLSSNPISVNVKPLPEGAPDGFNGAVGSYQMQAWVDNTKTVTNAPISLKVKISGKGNLSLFDAPTIHLPSDMESFDPKVADNTKVSLSGMSGDKVYEFLIIPRNVGNFKIDPIVFSYFDTRTNTYKTIKSDEFHIQVGKGNGESATNISGVSREELKLLGKDIRYIKSDADLERRSHSGFFGSQEFIILLGLPFILFLLLFILLSKRRKDNENEDLMRNKKANKLAQKRLSTAGEALKQDNSKQFYEEISKALWGYISDKLNIPVSELNKDVVRTKLIGINIDETKVNNFLNVLEESEFARYSPGADTTGKMNETYNKAGEAITSIERGIR